MARPRGRLLLFTRVEGGGRGRRGRSAEHMRGAMVGRMSLHTYIERHFVDDTGADKGELGRRGVYKAKRRWTRRLYDAWSSEQCRCLTRSRPLPVCVETPPAEPFTTVAEGESDGTSRLRLVTERVLPPSHREGDNGPAPGSVTVVHLNEGDGAT